MFQPQVTGAETLGAARNLGKMPKEMADQREASGGKEACRERLRESDKVEVGALGSPGAAGIDGALGCGGVIGVLGAGGDAKIPHTDLALRELLLGRTDIQNRRRRPPRPRPAGALWGLRESESGSERVHHASWTLEAKPWTELRPLCGSRQPERGARRSLQTAMFSGECSLLGHLPARELRTGDQRQRRLGAASLPFGGLNGPGEGVGAGP